MTSVLRALEAIAEHCAEANCVEPRVVLEFTHKSDLQKFETLMLRNHRAIDASAIESRNPFTTLRWMGVKLILSIRGPA